MSSEREIPIRMSHYLGCLSKPAVFTRALSKGKRNAVDLISHYTLFDPETTELTIIYIHPNNDLLRHISLLSYTTLSGVSRPDEDDLGRGSSGRENQPEGPKVAFSPNHRNNELGFLLPRSPNQVLIPTRCRSKLDYQVR